MRDVFSSTSRQLRRVAPQTMASSPGTAAQAAASIAGSDRGRLTKQEMIRSP
jgi:hypothetical protein